MLNLEPCNQPSPCSVQDVPPHKIVNLKRERAKSPGNCHAPLSLVVASICMDNVRFWMLGQFCQCVGWLHELFCCALSSPICSAECDSLPSPGRLSALIDSAVRECFLIFTLHLLLLNFIPLVLVTPPGTSRQLPSPECCHASSKTWVYLFIEMTCLCLHIVRGPFKQLLCLYLLIRFY